MATFRRSATTRRDDQHTCCCYYYFKLVFLLFDRFSATYIYSNKDLYRDPTTTLFLFPPYLPTRNLSTHLNIGRVRCEILNTFNQYIYFCSKIYLEFQFR